MTTMMMLFWDLHTPDDDGCGGGGGDDDDDDDASHLRSPRGTWSMYRALDLPHSVASTCEPRPAIHRRKKREKRTKTLTDDCSALYWTQELGLTCMESGRRAASNEPSCFLRR